MLGVRISPPLPLSKKPDLVSGFFRLCLLNFLLLLCFSAACRWLDGTHFGNIATFTVLLIGPMNQYQAFILKEMGITTWCLASSQQPALSIDRQTKMLILAEPDALESDFVVAVLKSMQLTPAQAQVTDLARFRAYQGPLPLWVWSTLIPLDPLPGIQVINSADIAQVSQDAQQKRLLWQQIKTYQAQSSPLS